MSESCNDVLGHIAMLDDDPDVWLMILMSQSEPDVLDDITTSRSDPLNLDQILTFASNRDEQTGSSSLFIVLCFSQMRITVN